MLHYVDDDSNSMIILCSNFPMFKVVSSFILISCLCLFQYSPAPEAIKQPPTTFGEPIVPKIPMVSEVTSLHASQVVSRASPALFSRAAVVPEVLIPQSQASSQVYKYFYLYFLLCSSLLVNTCLFFFLCFRFLVRARVTFFPLPRARLTSLSRQRQPHHPHPFPRFQAQCQYTNFTSFFFLLLISFVAYHFDLFSLVCNRVHTRA